MPTKRIATVKCTHVIAQVSLGYYDEAGHLIGEETFPQANGNLIAAKLFHPHVEELASLIRTCTEQAWVKLINLGQADLRAREGDNPGDGRGVEETAEGTDERARRKTKR